jgi:hypothetical protein
MCELSCKFGRNPIVLVQHATTTTHSNNNKPSSDERRDCILPEAVSLAVSFACSMLSADCLHTQLLSLSVHFSTFSRKPSDDGLVPSGHYNTIQNTTTGVHGCRIHVFTSLLERCPLSA